MILFAKLRRLLRSQRPTVACFAVALAVVPLVLAINGQSEDDDVITVDSSVVVANVYVADRHGQAVSGLGQELFTILDNGKPQKIESFTVESTPFAAVILIDSSGSMEYRVSNARSAAIKFLEGLRGKTSRPSRVSIARSKCFAILKQAATFRISFLTLKPTV